MRPDRLWIFPVVAVCLLLLAFASAGDAFGASSQGGVVTAPYGRAQAPPDAPQLDFFLTGTTDLSHDGCGTAQSFAVPPGTDIRFCYFAGNPGTVTFTRHDLSDSQGVIFANFPYTLTPGNAMYLMQNRHPVSAGSNVAQWSAYNPGPIDLVTSSDSTPIVMTPALVACNGATSTFSNGIPVGWTSYDWLALTAQPDSAVDWSDLAGCGEAANYTGGRGDAACASSALAGPQAYDTQLRTHSFSLVGQTSASVEFLLNYQDFASGDALYLDYSLDGGATWVNLTQSSATDFGAFRALPGASLAVDLAALLGEPDVRLAWRYVNHSASASDYYVQVDNVRLACSGGIFYDGFESGDTDAWSAAVAF